MGLARPEGVFLAVFLTLGLAYFLWRWSYFGHPLPNPFYKKGAGLLHWYSLRQSFKNLAALGPPFLFVLALGLLVKGLRRWALFALLPVVAFTALWILISDETYPARPARLLGAGRARPPGEGRRDEGGGPPRSARVADRPRGGDRPRPL
jgi:hypothetical protein